MLKPFEPLDNLPKMVLDRPNDTYYLFVKGKDDPIEVTAGSAFDAVVAGNLTAPVRIMNIKDFLGTAIVNQHITSERDAEKQSQKSEESDSESEEKGEDSESEENPEEESKEEENKEEE